MPDLQGLRELAVDQKRMVRVLEELGGDKLILGVMCGGFAMHEVLIELNDDEKALFKRGGFESLHTLALKISRNPKKLEQRRYRHADAVPSAKSELDN